MNTKELHVVALSGGKDSSAMALRLLEVEPRDYVFVVTPTGNELPEMFAHWRRLGELLGRKLTPVVGGSLRGVIREQGMIPNFWARFCTRQLKIEPFAAWMIQQRDKVDRIVSYIGLRADEEATREGGDYSKIDGVDVDFPLQRWGWNLREVVDYLAAREVSIPARTDCAWCFFQRLIEWWLLWSEHPKLYAEAEAIEASIGHTFRSPSRDTQPAGLRELREKFETGYIPRDTRDKVAEAKCRVCRL